MFVKIRVMGQLPYYITQFNGGFHILTTYKFMLSKIRVMWQLPCYITQDMQVRCLHILKKIYKLGMIRRLQWVS